MGGTLDTISAQQDASAGEPLLAGEEARGRLPFRLAPALGFSLSSVVRWREFPPEFVLWLWRTRGRAEFFTCL